MFKLFIFIFCALSVNGLINHREKPTFFKYNAEDVVKADADNSIYRLPGHTVPVSYNVWLQTDIHKNEFSFDGQVEISVNVIQETNEIVLHKYLLTIGEITLKDSLNVQIPTQPYSYNSTTDFLSIQLANGNLVVGNTYLLSIAFNGTLRGTKAFDDDAGFYRSSYKNEQGDEIWLAATQFEPADARHGFPCYDEPALKATFKITIVHGKEYNAISNMPVESSIINDDHATTVFQTTPKMSTYLVAYIVSDFGYIEANNFNLLHRTYGPKFRLSELPFTLEASEKILDDLQKYLNVSYSLPKMDQAGIPDFSAGAMENWGLVTYAELYYYLNNNSRYDQNEIIAEIVAHEFAHQFFGNLVSPEWWKYLWLNEGFATLYEYLIVERVYPQFQSMDYFVTSVLQKTFIVDSSLNTRPMTQDAFTKRDIDYLFDNVAYDKSGAVLRMLMHALTEPVFVNGLNVYLNERQYNYANSDHLFGALHSVASSQIPSTVTLTEIMNTWTTQPGFPVLHVTRNYETGELTLTQERYLASSVTDPNKTTWWLPYNYVTASQATGPLSTAPDGWIENVANKTMQPISLRPADWILFNKEQTGYYRVNYDLENWNLLSNALIENLNSFHKLNRAQLVDDSFNLARTGRLGYDVPLTIFAYASKETQYNPWVAISGALTFLEQKIFGSESYVKLLRYIADVAEPVYDEFGVGDKDTDLYNDAFTRAILIDWSCRAGYYKCLDDTTTALTKHLAGEIVVSNYIRNTVIYNGLRKSDYFLFWDVFTLAHSSTGNDRSVFLTALGYTESFSNLERLIEILITENTRNIKEIKLNLSPAERSRIGQSLINNNYLGHQLVWEMLIKESTAVNITFGDSVIVLLRAISNRISTEDGVKKFEDVTKLYQTTANSAEISILLSNIKTNLEWIAANYPDIKAKLDSLFQSNDTPQGYRLPTDTVPSSYNVWLKTDIHKAVFEFEGKVTIGVDVRTETNKIVIHQRQLYIDKVSLTDAVTKETINVKTAKYDKTTEFLTIETAVGNYKVGSYALVIQYSGILRGVKGKDADAGFYRSSYTNENGKEVWLAATQFESTDARHGFPCYDEPALKAHVRVTIVHGDVYNALSNMPVESRVVTDGYVETVFLESPLMSTYLVAFIVSDYEYVQKVQTSQFNPGGILHRAYGIGSRKSELNFTLEAGVKILKDLEEYVNVPYGLTKMDQIAIPDFAAGAMENWGLVTYTVSRFYYDEYTAAHNQKERIAKLIAHEFAHQFFGDLVSPEWWSYIWLNEGFATVFEYYTIARVYPEYSSMDGFVVDSLQKVFVVDSSESIRPMTQTANTPAQISRLFDSIAYDKSGVVIVMFMHALTEPIFRSGLNFYLNGRKYNSANSDHLYNALQTAASIAKVIPSGTTVNQIMNTWSTQPGFPVVTVTRDYDTGDIVLLQERYLAGTQNDPDNRTWWIPYNYIVSNELTDNNWDTRPDGWIQNERYTTIKTSELRTWTKTEWILFNKKQTGYYRVNYDLTNWGLLATELNTNFQNFTIHKLNRAQLVDDVFNLARTDRLSYSIVLKLVKYIKNEVEYAPWVSFNGGITWAHQKFYASSISEKLNNFIRDATEPLFDKLTVSELLTDSYRDVFIRGYIIDWACRAGLPKCLTSTSTALKMDLSFDKEISVYLRNTVTLNGLRNADATLFWSIFDLAQSADSSTMDRTLYLRALGYAEQTGNLKNLFKVLVTANGISIDSHMVNLTAADRRTILESIINNNYKAFDLVFSHLKTDTAQFDSLFGTQMSSVLSELAGRITISKYYELLKELVDIYKTESNEATLTGYINTAGSNVNWVVRRLNEVKPELDNMYPDGPGSATSTVSSTFVILLAVFITFIRH